MNADEQNQRVDGVLVFGFQSAFICVHLRFLSVPVVESSPAMARLKFTLDVAAPADRVFVFFIPQRMPHWYGYEMDMHFEVQGGEAEFQVGQKVRLAGRLGGREVSLTAVVTRYQWQRVLEWQFRDEYGVRGLQRWEVEPISPVIPSPPLALSEVEGRANEESQGLGSPQAQLTMYDEYELPGHFGRLFDALVMRWNVARRDRRWLEKLRRLAEHR